MRFSIILSNFNQNLTIDYNKNQIEGENGRINFLKSININKTNAFMIEQCFEIDAKSGN